jgi:outer membrane protein OmpA-like peptidoglycan-associated protein
MKSSRNAALAAASLLAAFSAAPTAANADERVFPGQEKREKENNRQGQQGQGGQREGKPQGQQGKPQGQQGKPQGQQGKPQGQAGKPQWQQGKPQGQNQGQGQGQGQGQQKKNWQGQGNGGQKPGKPAFGQNQPPNGQQKHFGNGSQGGNPNAFVKPQAPQKPPVADKAFVPQQQQQQPQKPQHQNAGQPNFNNKPVQNNNQNDQFQKPAGNRDWKQGAPNQKPNPVGNPGQFNKPGNPNFGGQNRPRQSAADAKRNFEAMRGQRKEVKIDGGKGVVIEEPGKRRIFRENNRVMITHDDNERLRRVAPNARFQKGKGGSNIAIIDRPGGSKIYSETDQHGQLLRRYRRGPDGRDFIIIDNRRRRHDNFGRNLAAGVGIGVGVVAGAAILNSFLDVPPPRITIPRDEYIVDYERASDEDVYDALSAPPVEDFRDRYTLDEIRATAALRNRMRRVDLDDITFDFGSWEVDPEEYSKLDRIARAMRRVIQRNPNEVFMIEGYTDAVGSPEDNLSLSDRRAESVAEVLSEQFQIPFENLTTQGYGEEYLKVPTQAPERINRRVAVRRITPLLARGNGQPPPPPSGDRQPTYDDGPANGGPDNGGPDDGGPDDGQGYDGPPPAGGGSQD